MGAVGGTPPGESPLSADAARIRDLERQVAAMAQVHDGDDPEAAAQVRRLLLETQDNILGRLQTLEAERPKNAFKLKPRDGHHHTEPVRVLERATDKGFGFELDFHRATVSRGSGFDNRKFTIDVGGIGPFPYGYLVDVKWADEVSAGRGTEGQEFTTFHGRSFKVFSTLPEAIDDAVSASNQTFLIADGSYSMGAGRTIAAGKWSFIGASGGPDSVQSTITGSTSPLFTLDGNAGHIGAVSFENLNFRVDVDPGIAITTRIATHVRACNFFLGAPGSGEVGIEMTGFLPALGNQLHAESCLFDGGTGVSITGRNTGQQIRGCRFTDSLLSLVGNVGTLIEGNYFWHEAGVVLKTTGSSGIHLIGNNFSRDDGNAGITVGVGNANTLTIVGNHFWNDDIALALLGIDFEVSAFTRTVVVIADNSFHGRGTVGGIGIRGRSSIENSLIQGNVFHGVPTPILDWDLGSGNEAYHNLSQDGFGVQVAIADIGSPVGHINVAADLPGHTHEGSTEGGGTLTPTDLLWAAATELTIATGAITATQSHHTIDTQADAGTDDLDTINGLVANQLYFFRPANDARTVVLKHGTGNLLCIGNQDFSLNDVHDFIWAFSPDGATVYVGGPHNAPVFVSGTEPTSRQDGQLWLDTAASGTGGLGVLNVTTITTSTTLTTSQTVVLCNAASGAITVTLPTAVGNDGRHYHIKKIDSSGNAVTIDGDGSETIDGETTQVIAAQYNSINIVSDGSAWHIL